ncbi:MAG: phosphopeptide-binding protein [Candidatus Cyclobacteriaceae bacterium M3_2C_046]
MIISGLTVQCENTRKQDEQQNTITSKVTLQKIAETNVYPDAILELREPTGYVRTDPGLVQFVFDVKNFPLSQPTAIPDSLVNLPAQPGQHLHLILNNQSYGCHLDPVFPVNLTPGDYVALAFLSRPWHQSIKHYGAYVLRTFTTGNQDEIDFDDTAPHLFYNQPQGQQTYPAGQPVLLDFYLINTDLGPEAMQVKAEIDQQEFWLQDWTGYLIEGLVPGEHQIRLSLRDQQGTLVDGPYNMVERTINIK